MLWLSIVQFKHCLNWKSQQVKQPFGSGKVVIPGNATCRAMSVWRTSTFWVSRSAKGTGIYWNPLKQYSRYSRSPFFSGAKDLVIMLHCDTVLIYTLIHHIRYMMSLCVTPSHIGSTNITSIRIRTGSRCGPVVASGCQLASGEPGVPCRCNPSSEIAPRLWDRQPGWAADVPSGCSSGF